MVEQIAGGVLAFSFFAAFGPPQLFSPSMAAAGITRCTCGWHTNSNRQFITGVKNQVLTVIMLSQGAKLKPYEMRYSVALKPGNSFTAQTPVITSTNYYDINGNILSDATNYNVEIR